MGTSGRGLACLALVAATCWAQADKPRLVAQLGHADHATCVAFVPGGRKLATGDFHGNVILWDLATGNELRRVLGLRGRRPRAL